MTCLLALLAATALAPGAPDAALADSLLHYGFYRPAAAEYRRVLFSVTDTGAAGRRDSARAALGLGLALGAAGDRAGADAALRRAAELDSSCQAAAGMALVGLETRARDFGRARAELSTLSLFAADDSSRSRLRLAGAWLDLAAGDPAAAAAQCAGAGRPDLAALVRHKAAGRRSPLTAMLLSTFVPGAGEAYAGRPFTGALSLLVNAGSVAGVYWAAKSDDWVTASAVFSFLLVRFYTGSRRNAADFADRFNRELLERASRGLRGPLPEPDWFRGVRPCVGPEYPPAPAADSS